MSTSTLQEAVSRAGIGGTVQDTEAGHTFQVVAHTERVVQLREDDGEPVTRRYSSSSAQRPCWRALAHADGTDVVDVPDLAHTTTTETDRSPTVYVGFGDAAQAAGVGGTVGWYGWAPERGGAIGRDPFTVFRVTRLTADSALLDGVSGNDMGMRDYSVGLTHDGRWAALTTQTVTITDPAQLADIAAWLIAEAKYHAEVEIAATRALAATQNDVLAAELMRVTRNAESAVTSARAEVEPELRELVRERDKLQELVDMFKPGGIVNRVACLRGDQTSQCSELDRTLRGIGFYDRDGYTRGRHDQLSEATEFGRDWYRNKYNVVVSVAAARTPGAPLVRTQVSVVAPGSNPLDARASIEHGRVETVTRDALGWTELHDFTWESTDENVTEHADNYQVSAFTD